MKKVMKILGWCALLIIAGVMLMNYIDGKKMEAAREVAAKESAKIAATYIPVPNVMGIDRSEARGILERAGFTITEVSADPSSILSVYTSYDDRINNRNRPVKKGEVFRVNEVVTPLYTSNTRVAKDKNLTIYYAKNNYLIAETPEVTIVEWKEYLKEYLATLTRITTKLSKIG